MRLVQEKPAECKPVLFYTDAHISDQNPLSRVDDYRSAILKKLVDVVRIARDEDASPVINGGDLFHSKQARSTSHHTVSLLGRIFEALNPEARGHIVCVGNHDVTYGRWENWEKQPLGVLAHWGVFEVPGQRAEAGLAYPPVFVTHADYKEEGDAALLASLPSAEGDEPLFHVVHSMLLRDDHPGYPGVDVIRWSEYAAQATNRVVLLGHPHTPQVCAEVGGNVFVAPGALGRSDRTQTYDHPCVALVWVDASAEEVYVEYRPLPSARPYAEVFAGESVLEIALQDMAVHQFVEQQLARVEVSAKLGREDLRARIRAMEGLSKEVMAKALDYVGSD